MNAQKYNTKYNKKVAHFKTLLKTRNASLDAALQIIKQLNLYLSNDPGTYRTVLHNF